LTQRSSARYFNRPDADHLEFDSTRTSMSGYDAAASLMYQGKPFYGSLAVSQTSPGYESNDLGYMSRADVRSIAGAFGAQMSGGRGLVRDGRARVYALQGANLGGDVIYRKVGTTASATLNSLWNVSFGASIKPAALDDRTTRGGPLTKFPSVVHFDGSISSDSRKPLMLYVFAAHETFGKSSMWAMYESQLTIRPAPSLRMSIGPSVELNRDEGFFIRSFADSTASSTFGRRYVFADLDLRTTSLTARADWTLTPDLSFQLFAQPFRSNVSYADYKTLRAPSTYSFDPFNDPAATDGFSLRTLRMNAVARWEFRAGSSLYLVWQQAQEGGNAAAQNIFLVKGSYRIGR
jgi:hypothetical protein